jgi:hypothetical protein
MSTTPSIEKKELKELKQLTLKFNQKYQDIECAESQYQ